MSTRAIRRGVTTIATAGGLLVLSVLFAAAQAAGKPVAAKRQLLASGGAGYTLSFSPPKPNAKSNLTLNLTDSLQPASVAVSLPAGVKLNLSALPKCATAPTCEPATQVGSGSATVVVNGYKIPLNLLVFNDPGGLAVVIQNPNGTPIVKSATWSGTQLTIPYPNSYYTQGQCADKTNGCPIVVTQLSLTFNTVGVGTGTYLRTPGTCKASGWSSTAAFTFQNGTSGQVTSAAKCGKWAVKQKPKRKPSKRKR